MLRLEKVIYSLDAYYILNHYYFRNKKWYFDVHHKSGCSESVSFLTNHRLLPK